MIQFLLIHSHIHVPSSVCKRRSAVFFSLMVAVFIPPPLLSVLASINHPLLWYSYCFGSVLLPGPFGYFFCACVRGEKGRERERKRRRGDELERKKEMRVSFLSSFNNSSLLNVFFSSLHSLSFFSIQFYFLATAVRVFILRPANARLIACCWLLV